MWDPYLQCGILNDFDLAKLVAEMENEPASKHRIGTLPFVAIDILDGKNDPYLLRFDLESFLYVIMWIVARFEDGRDKYNSLGEWLSGSPTLLRVQKFGLLMDTHPSPWKNSRTYPTIYESWIRPLRRHFDRFFFARRNGYDFPIVKEITDEYSANRWLINMFLDVLKH